MQTCLRLAKNRKKYDNLLISCVKEPTKDATLEEVGFLKAREIFAVCSNRQKQEYLTSNAQYNLIDLASLKEDNSYPIKDILALLAVLFFFALYFIDEELFLNVFLFFYSKFIGCIFDYRVYYLCWNYYIGWLFAFCNNKKDIEIIRMLQCYI